MRETAVLGLRAAIAAAACAARQRVVDTPSRIADAFAAFRVCASGRWVIYFEAANVWPQRVLGGFCPRGLTVLKINWYNE